MQGDVVGSIDKLVDHFTGDLAITLAEGVAIPPAGLDERPLVIAPVGLI
jgi:hypothetical protein